MTEVKFGHKILCFLKEADKIVNDELQLPVSFEIDASNYCQNRCSFCMFAEHIEANRVHLSMLSYLRALIEIRDMGVKSITFTGGGEPLMNPNIREMIMLAVKADMRVGLVTNGVLLPIVYDILYMLEYVRISMDSATRETYLKIKGKDYFDMVCENVFNMRDHLYGLLGEPQPAIGLSFVIVEDNKHEINEFHELADQLMIDYAQVKPELKVCDMETQTKDVDKSKFFLTERYNIDSKSTTACKLAGLIGIINATGKVYYCCVHRGKKQFEIGDINDRNLTDIYSKVRPIFRPDLRLCTTSCRYMNYSKIYEQVRDKRFIPLRHRKFI